MQSAIDNYEGVQQMVQNAWDNNSSSDQNGENSSEIQSGNEDNASTLTSNEFNFTSQNQKPDYQTISKKDIAVGFIFNSNNPEEGTMLGVATSYTVDGVIRPEIQKDSKIAMTLNITLFHVSIVYAKTIYGLECRLLWVRTD